MSDVYSEGNDFIVLGLTGQTGSGCSTVASILCSEKNNIKNSLYQGDNPNNNDERKQRIILKRFSTDWEVFTLIQVRSLITLEMALTKLPDNIDEVIKHYGIDDEKFNDIKSKLDELKDKFDEIVKSHENEILSMDECKNTLDFYNLFLPDLCGKIKTLLGESNFINLYQYVGKNLRTSGNVYNDKEVEGNTFAISKRINDAIKRIRKANKTLKNNTLIVIDAIRNPFEALFFQERYSSFYLVAISCPDEERKQRLRDKGLTDTAIKLIDEQEYQLKDFDDTAAYYVQDIQSCLQRADIYINNPDEKHKVNEFKLLANQIIKFIMLMKRPGIITPSAVERCMQLAYTAKLNSGCISRQVGAAVTDNNYSVRSIGWNDVPYGQVPCNLRSRFDLSAGKDSNAYSRYEKNNVQFLGEICNSLVSYEKIAINQNVPYCFKTEYSKITNEKNQVHTRSLHAEENAFLQLSKYGGPGIDGGVLFTTASPCELCSKKAYQLGIKKIYYIDPYPGIAIDHILNGGVNNPELILFSGAIGKAFHRLYMPMTAYKDELSALSK